MRKVLLILALAVAMTSGIVSIADTPVIAHDPGDGTEGCTPGFWKTHLDVWPAGFSPGDFLVDHFFNSALYGLGGATLLEALGFSGGAGTVGAARILLRAGVAALLNSAGVDYPLSTADVQGVVNNLLATNDRNAMLAGATLLDGFNNLGCPFPDVGK